MTGYLQLTKRNLRLFFKDKAMFFTSLITPAILLVLYATFLATVYRDSLLSSFPEGVSVADRLLGATVGGQLAASLLSVSCVTVSFCANLLMIGDRANGTSRDFSVSPVGRGTVAAAYFTASAASTLIVNFTAYALCLGYLALKGWYLSVADVLLVAADVVLLTLFGTALSSCLHFFLKTNGQASAVGTIVSAGYGFICGAYMPISTFPTGLQNLLSFLPGTYGTALLKNQLLRGAFAEMEASGIPAEAIRDIRAAIDCDMAFFSHKVSLFAMAGILIGAVVLFSGLFVLFHILAGHRRAPRTPAPAKR